MSNRPKNDVTASVLRLLRGPRHEHAGVLRMPAARGDQGAADTIEAMRRIVYDADRSPHVHQWASAIVAASPNRDRYAQLDALRRSLIDTLNFKPDTFGSEVLRTPDQLISEIRINGKTACDCDDVAMLGVSISRSMGMEGAFVTIARTDPGNFVHVYFAVKTINMGWIPLDPQERVPLGVWTPGGKRCTLWRLAR